MAMRRYLVKRVGQALFTIFAVVNITFFLIRYMPGGPVDFLRAQLMSGPGAPDQETINRKIAAYVNLQPDQPLHVQYADYMTSLLQGDLGHSLLHQEDIMSIIGPAIPWTVFLMTISVMITFTIGISIGIVMAYNQGSRVDFSLTGLSLLIDSIPFYVIAILLLYFLATIYNVFPEGGRFGDEVTPGPNIPFLLSAAYHAILPILSLATAGFGGYAIGMRANSISVLGDEFMRVGRLRGLPDSRLIYRYVGYNSILPLYTGLILSIGFVFGGSVILERIFRYRGLGWHLFRGVASRDYPLMMGIFLLITIAVTIAVFFADLTYAYIDPRARVSDDESGSGTDVMTTLKRWSRRLKQRTSGGSSPHSSIESELSTDRGSVVPTREKYEDIEYGTQTVLANFVKELQIRLTIMWEDFRTKIGAAILLVYLLMGTIGVLLLEPASMAEAEFLMAPFQSTEFILGTDGAGRGILAQIIHATPPMLKMIIAGATFAIGVGTLIAVISGYLGGSVDMLLMTLSDIAITIPGLPLVIVLAVALEPENPFVIGFILTVNAWGGTSRGLRSEVLKIREESYVESSTIMGVPILKLIQEDIMPNIMPLVLINFASAARNVIFNSVALYFLGVLPFTTENWGVMLNQAYTSANALYSLDAAHWFIFPMIAIAGLSFGLTLFAQGMDRLFNPRIRAQHKETEAEETISKEPETTIPPAD